MMKKIFALLTLFIAVIATVAISQLDSLDTESAESTFPIATQTVSGYAQTKASEPAAIREPESGGYDENLDTLATEPERSNFEPYDQQRYDNESGAMKLVKDCVPELEAYSYYIRTKSAGEIGSTMFVTTSNRTLVGYDHDEYYMVYFGERWPDHQVNWDWFIIDLDFKEVMWLDVVFGLDATKEVLTLDEWRASKYYRNPDELLAEISALPSVVQSVESTTVAPVADSNDQDKVLAARTAISAIRDKDIDLFRSVCADEVDIMRYFNSGNGMRGKNIGFLLRNDELPESFEIEVDGEIPIALSKMFVYSNASDDCRIIISDFNFEDGVESPPGVRGKILTVVKQYASSVSCVSSIIIGEEYFLLTDVEADNSDVNSPFIHGQCALFRAEDNKLVTIIDIRY